jgi:putative oxidoreductase
MNATSTVPANSAESVESVAYVESTTIHTTSLHRWAMRYARIALGAAFLSAVAARFGLWGSRSSWKSFSDFEAYTAQVNSFMPAVTIPYLAWAATAAELSIGTLLVLGLWPRKVAFAAALLLAAFATAMAVSFGIKSPLDYSVYSASAAALLLALHQPREAE